MSFLYSTLLSIATGFVKRQIGAFIITGLVLAGLGTVYVKGMAHGSSRTEKKLRPEIERLRKDVKKYETALNEVKRLEAELNNDLENARKEGDSIKPVTGGKPADRLRVITGYPGCRDCK